MGSEQMRSVCCVSWDMKLTRLFFNEPFNHRLPSQESPPSQSLHDRNQLTNRLTLLVVRLKTGDLMTR